MARKVRIFVKDSSHHVIIKSLDKLTIFRDEMDYKAFATILKESSENNDLAVHAYVLMPHYFEFLATPSNQDALSKFMQSLGRKYVGYYNKKYNRAGTIWEGRYKSSLVENNKFLFDVMIYLEKLAPRKHHFCSIYKNLYSKKDDIVSYHSLYKKLGFTDEQRVQKYSALFNSKTDNGEFIATSLEKQSVTGSLEFVKKLEKIVGMNLSSRERGRPKKDYIEKGKKMYKNLVILDKEKHKELKISPLVDFDFAKSVTHIPVLADEISQIGATFPIVFTANKIPSLMAIVSLGTESLAINKDGKWSASYIPSYLRKYPFSLASTKENSEQKVILIDESSSLFSKSKGKQLFKKDGKKSETLEHTVNFLTAYDAQMRATLNVVKIILQSGILDDKEISIGHGDEKKILVGGFKVVNRRKLNALSDDVLADWARKGILTIIDAHLKSLSKVQALFDIAQKRQS